MEELRQNSDIQERGKEGGRGRPSGSRQGSKVSARSLTISALLAAAALMLSYVEFLVPVNLGLPGIKTGFANICVVLALYYLGPRYALAINIVRIALCAMLFGSLSSGLYALCGGMVSLAAMILLKKTEVFSITGVSMAGGAFHNLAQAALACAAASTAKMFLYLPVLLIAGMIAGIFNGVVANLVLRKLT